MTGQQMDNLLSGFFGAIIAVSITSMFDRITKAIRINKIRRTLIDYLKHIALDKTNRYEKDMELIKTKIKTTDEKEIHEKEQKSVDAMPMLTSEIFKSYSPDELNRVCYNTTNFTVLLDIYYSIDFLKENMPLDIYSKYVAKIAVHFEEKKLESGIEQIEHLKTCGVLKEYADFSYSDAEHKRGRAKTTHERIKVLIKSLDGNSFAWTIKYIFS